jgi:hypothetical protein
MIQRKQTIFLLLAIVLTIVCLCLPLGHFEPKGMGTGLKMYNLWLVDGNGGHNFSVWALFAILLVSCPINILAVFSYHNRILQSRLCVFNILLIIGWYIVFALFANIKGGDSFTFHLSITSCLPLIVLILYFMARRGIVKDEKMVRAADRIR